MESVTDCWLCRLVIDLSGERCFSQAATVLWKPQERVRGLSGRDTDQALTAHTWHNGFKKKKKKYLLLLELGDECTTEGGAWNNARDSTDYSFTDLCHPLQISDLAVGIRCCSKLRRGMLQHMDFRLAGARDRMSTNLKLLAAIDLGVLARPFVGREQEHPFCGNSSRYSSSDNWALI